MPKGIYKKTEEHKKKISLAHLGKKHTKKAKEKMSKAKQNMSKETKEKMSKTKKRNGFIPPSRKGVKLSKKHKLKISKANKGRILSKEWKKKIGLANKGKKRSKKVIKEMIKRMKGKNAGKKSNFWKGGITPEHLRIRSSIEMRLWREAVFARDNYTCQKCDKQKSGELNAHHIYNFAQFPELRFAIDNGITFCEKCHKRFHRKYGRINNSKEQILLYLK